MPIKDLLVHLDDTPASTTRLQAALALAAACGAQVSALYLVAEPFLPGMGGRHLPAVTPVLVGRHRQYGRPVGRVRSRREAVLPRVLRP